MSRNTFWKDEDHDKHQSRYEDNQKFEDRVIDKKLGYIKYHLINDAKKKDEGVKIIWPKKMVTVRDKSCLVRW